MLSFVRNVPCGNTQHSNPLYPLLSPQPYRLSPYTYIQLCFICRIFSGRMSNCKTRTLFSLALQQGDAARGSHTYAAVFILFQQTHGRWGGVKVARGHTAGGIACSARSDSHPPSHSAHDRPQTGGKDTHTQTNTHTSLSHLLFQAFWSNIWCERTKRSTVRGLKRSNETTLPSLSSWRTRHAAAPSS